MTLSNPIDPLQNSPDTSLTVFGMRLRSDRGLRAGRPPCSQADERARAAIDQAQGDVGEAMGVPRKHVNELCNGRRAVTAPTALIVARVFGNTKGPNKNPRKPGVVVSLRSSGA